MNTINHLIGAASRLLIWVAGALLLEELTVAGLARLIVRQVSEARRERAEEGGSARFGESGHAGCGGSGLAVNTKWRRHVAGAAKALGLERGYLYKTCLQLGIDLLRAPEAGPGAAAATLDT